MPTVSVTEAARNFSDLISRTYYRHETTVLTKGGRAVARIVPFERTAVTGGELAACWASLPHLGGGDAEAFGREIETAKQALPAPRDPWA
jgi:prevent-host-death family protein